MSRTLQAALIALCIMAAFWFAVDAVYAIVQVLDTLKLLPRRF